MIKAHYDWQDQSAQVDLTQAQALQDSLGVSPVMAKLLVSRGLTDPTQAENFLKPSIEMVHDPHLLHDMDKAVERISDAVANGEKITIYGDYDADGITSTSVMYEALNGIGANVDYYIPDRFKDGYGPNADAYQRIIESGTQLIVTVDNGVSGKDVINPVMDQGVDVVITDHHELPEELPNAVAIVHPRYPGSDYPFPDLSGVAVAFKVAWALLDEFPEEQLDLLAIGEIADVVGVTDENRALISMGIQVLRQGMRPGLHALISLAGANESQLTDQDIGFTIAPRLNALGRIANAGEGVELLTTLDEDRGKELAAKVEEANKERRQYVDDIMEEALAQATDEENSQLPVLVLLGHNWHQGVLGIVASRIMEETGKPTIVAGVNDGDTVAKASGRSIDGFNLFDALNPHRDLFVAFGGHPAACGLSFEADKLHDLRDALAQEASNQGFSGQERSKMRVDGHLVAGEINEQLYQEVQQLGPFGPGNEQPVFELKGIAPTNVKTMGKDNSHLKFNLGPIAVVAFGKGNLAPMLNGQGADIDILVTLSINEWHGRRSVQLMLVDIQIGGTVILDQRTNHLTPQHFEMGGYYVVADQRLRANIAPHVEAGHALSPEEARAVDFAGDNITVVDCPPQLDLFKEIFAGDTDLPSTIRLLLYETDSIYLAGMPTRDDFAALYRFLSQYKNIKWPIQREAMSRQLRINEVRLNLMIDVFSEVGFVKIEDGLLNLVEGVTKADLKQTDHYQAQLARYEVEQTLLFSDAATLSKWVMQCLS
ncbi:MAG: single-stranded-DNA-specific exonuclease RecJ [Limosilactobacillus sp.]|uniref:single-stranded-DNA-specific exonuclease RecJ n=1 Tax=Limosilactobacillus sp. TaxID=2773925 RepID=UPI0026F6810B|nr:single-stranded-DNA-specific exonuclease RecJ [Limosilactobacillus sp.]